MTAKENTQLLYLTYFNRAADQSGLSYWQARLEAGESIDSLHQAFANPDVPEISALYTDANTAESYISTVYRNLLNRDPDTSGLDYWSGRIQASLDQGVPLESAGLSMLAAFMNAAGGNTGVDADTLAAKLVVADTITEISSETPEKINELSQQFLNAKNLSSLDEQALSRLQETILEESKADEDSGSGQNGNNGSLPPFELPLDSLDSTDLVSFNLDAEGRDYLFIDSISQQSNTRISNFDESDSLTLIGVEAEGVRVQVSGDNTQIQFDDGAGLVSQIELVGVNGFFTNVEEFNLNSAFGDIQFA
jgi:hypothetical protein